MLTDEQMLEKVSVAVQSEIGVKHTMIEIDWKFHNFVIDICDGLDYLDSE